MKLSAMCSKAEYSSGDIIRKMKLWQLTEEAQHRILKRLTNEKYVDDERFCRSFIHEKICFDKWGRRKIETALYNKGIGKNIYTPILDEIPDEKYTAVLRGLLTAKRKNIKARNDYELNGKLIRYALGRGFGMNIIRQCTDYDECYDTGDDED